MQIISDLSFAFSKRQVSLLEAKEFVKLVPQTVKTVGVFQSPTVAEVKIVIVEVGLDMVQIHGQFDNQFLTNLHLPIIRTYQVSQNFIGLFDSLADFLLFDASLGCLEENGVSAIEIGLPFSDPVADRPVIEAAGLRSLAKGTSSRGFVESLQHVTTEISLIIMTYFNPIFQYGLENFIANLAHTAVKGLIIPDLPYEHVNIGQPFLEKSDIALIPLVSLTMGLEHQKKLIENAQGFIYAVAINGVIGNSHAYRTDLDQHFKRLTEVSPIPILTRFSVSGLDDVERFNHVSDGVIVRSKIVRALHEKAQTIVDLIKKQQLIRSKIIYYSKKSSK